MNIRDLERWMVPAVMLVLLGGFARHAPAEEADPPAFIEAQRAEARGDHARAEALYDSVFLEDSSHVTALLGRARMRSWLGRFHEAVLDYEVVLAREPDNVRAMSGIAWTHAWNKNFDEARRRFADLAKAEPYYLDAQKGLAYVELWSGNAREARRQFELLAQEDVGNPDYVLAIAQAAYLEGDLRGARAAFEKSLALKPELDAARSGLRAVEASEIERRPAFTILGGLSDSGDTENSGIRMVQVAKQISRNMRLWISHDRGVGFDGFSEDRIEQDAATTTIGGFFNITPRTGTRLELGVRDLATETQPVFSVEQVFFMPGGTTPKVGLWMANGDEGNQWVLNAGVHRWLTERLALEPTVYFGDDGSDREVRGALLATYTLPNRVQFGLGAAVGTKDSPGGERSVDRLFANASIPLTPRARLLFYGWREGTEGFADQTVLAAGVTFHL